VLVAVVAGALWLAPGARQGTAGLDVADPLPAFAAPDLGGKPVAFSDYAGNVMLVNVWATWCDPCRVEMPPIRAAYERFKDRGFTVLAVSIDAGPGYREKVERFVAEHGLSFPVLLDPEARIMRVLRTVGVPETLVVDRQGRIVKRMIGAADWNSAENQALIQELLRL
jgi:peroxiredoxin